MGRHHRPAGRTGEPDGSRRALALNTNWDPEQYLKFAGPRLRPALDLLSNISLDAPESVIDLGCGPGNVTAHLARRWPLARVVGVDHSREMIDAARFDFPALEFAESDIAGWEADDPWDLVYSNAALHWLGHHDLLFPHLLDQVVDGGVLAVQMPANFGEPSHTVAREIAAEPRWSGILDGALTENPVAELDDYHRWLAPTAGHLDIWETTYLHRLDGTDPVFQWFKGSWLRPILSRLDPAGAAMFEAAYSEAMAEAYPADESGVVLMPFRRIFVVASAGHGDG